MSKTTKVDRNFWRAFSTELSRQNEKRPTGEGWIPLDDWIKASGENRTTVSRKLMDGVRLGKMERFVGQLVRASGRANAASWFRPLKSGIKPRSDT